MCGIVGFTANGHDPAAAKRTAQAMADLIRHRGPDGEGYYADTRAALGHRRLSIIDIDGGGQPMFNEDGALVVVFNGEIYNYRALRTRLQRLGHRFATDSDTEVLLHGYEAWGTALPRRLRGMFAFALWDRRTGTLFCARDLFGIKPLYYYQRGRQLLFASEIKALLAHPAFEKKLNEARLPDWLSMEYLPDSETLFAGVYELPPAHTLLWQDGRLTTARYAAPQFRPRPGSLRHYAGAIGDALADSAAAHRIADVPVGCFLSGGVDSSLVVRETARNQPAVQCFAVGYAEQAYSELPAARAAAAALGVPLHETTVTAADFFAANRAIQWYLDEPMPNPAEVPLYFLCRAARQHVKVVLSGEGADELFGGYPLYQQAVWAGRWQAVPRALRRALAGLLPGCGFLRRGALPRWQRAARANYVFETTQERDKYLLRSYGAPAPARRCKPYFDAVRHLDEPTAVQWVDIQTWLPRDILRKADRMSMAHGLELRVPFLDRRVLAVALALPRRLRCTGRRGKPALRAAAACRLPGRLAEAPKRGFPVPLADWLRQDETYARVRAKLTGPVAARFFDTAALCALLDAHRAGTTNAMTKIWAFYCFIEWYELYFEEKIPPVL